MFRRVTVTSVRGMKLLTQALAHPSPHSSSHFLRTRTSPGFAIRSLSFNISMYEIPSAPVMLDDLFHSILSNLHSLEILDLGEIGYCNLSHTGLARIARDIPSRNLKKLMITRVKYLSCHLQEGTSNLKVVTQAFTDLHVDDSSKSSSSFTTSPLTAVPSPILLQSHEGPLKIDTSSMPSNMSNSGFPYSSCTTATAAIAPVFIHTPILENSHVFMDIFARKYSSNLVTLELRDCPLLPPVVLDSISQFKELSRLNLSFCGPSITHNVLMGILNGCQKLKRLDLAKCFCITNDSVIHIARRLNSNLKHLDVSFCDGILEPSGLRALADSCPNLEFLDVSGSFQLTSESLTHLASSACSKNLKTLILKECNEITDTGIQHLLYRCHALVHFDLTRLHLLTSRTLLYLLKEATPLQFLSIAGCPRVDELVILEYIQTNKQLLQIEIQLNGNGEIAKRILAHSGMSLDVSIRWNSF